LMSMAMLRHFPCLNRPRLDKQRVAMRTRIAIQVKY
jgi:hypothetical protein